LEWLRKIRRETYSLEFAPELLPNMKNENPLYVAEKKKLAEHYGEITEFWQCTIKHRLNLLDANMHSWRDPNFDVSLLGISKAYVDKVANLFKINRGELDVYPRKIRHDMYDWRTVSDEIFVDFETVGNPDENEESTIFLIGVWHKRGGKYAYTHFVANSLSEEKELVLAFHAFWQELGMPKVWYWYAENMFWNKVCKKYELDLSVGWVDLYKIFFEGVFVRGCKNFKLKSYVKALRDLGKIQIELPTGCCNGLEALFLGAEYYETKDLETLQSILTYNEFDCQSLHVLLQFIRKEL
jgi:uncharacterized protein YprB with RNaseH-like and TPR domain